MKRSRILIGLFAVFALSFGLLAAGPFVGKALATDTPLTASADAGKLTTQAVTNYGVWVAGKQVTSANAKNVLGNGTVSYNAKTNTLTLKNAKITNAYVERHDGGSWIWYSNYGILCNTSKTFTIKLMGKNSIAMPTKKSPIFNYGIFSYGSTVIEGSGSLSVKANKAQCFSIGVFANENLTLQGSAKVAAKGAATKVKNKKVNLANWYGGYGIGVGDNYRITMKGSAQLTANGTKKGIVAYENVHPKMSFVSYTPQVKAGNSSSSIKVNKKNPASSVYTKYKYVNITKAKATSKKPAKMTITKIAAFGGGFNVKWKTLSKNCTGYQFQFWKSGSSNKYTYLAPYTNNGDKVDGGSISDLAGGATYYMRVRGVNQVGSQTYYGAWSDTKSVTTLSGTPVG